MGYTYLSVSLSLSVSFSVALSLLVFYHKVLCTFGYPIGIPNYFAWHCNRGRSPVVSHLLLDSIRCGSLLVRVRGALTLLVRYLQFVLAFVLLRIKSGPS